MLLSREPVVDNAALEQRDDVLTFTSEPLPEHRGGDRGGVGVELWARAQPPHFDLFVRVCEVDRDGVSRNVCDGLAASTRTGLSARPDGTWTWPSICGRSRTGSRPATGSGSRSAPARTRGTRATRAPARTGRPGTAVRAVEVELLHDREHPVDAGAAARPDDDPRRAGW